jgi:hypothetical protein
MSELRDFLRASNFFARALTFGMIPLFFRISLSIGSWWMGPGISENLKFFGIAGILLGSLVGHQLYYYWIFPEKRKSGLSSK